jgi:phosphoenolpyruvate---glycerone phosphotransferase subunit DhaM
MFHCFKKGFFMVNLLIVAHSSALAHGVRELAEQVSGGQIQIAAVGGDHEGGLGTNVDQIVGALQQIATPAGVLILGDLSGAILSAETALDVVGELRAQISDAPLVEGAYLAAIEASVGGTLEQVAAAALQARTMRKLN